MKSDVNGVRVLWKSRSIPSVLRKYYNNRYSLFSKFDEGIWIDFTGWFSVTPEVIAIHQAQKILDNLGGDPSGKVVIEAFAGVGGNAIALARVGFKVLAIDIDETSLICLRHNAELYGVGDKISYVHDNFMTLDPHNYPKADAVFMSPPWGGPGYVMETNFNLEGMPISLSDVFFRAKLWADEVCLFLPRTGKRCQLEAIKPSTDLLEIEPQYVNAREKGISVHYSKLKD